MAQVTGTVTFPTGTGTKTINLGITPTWLRIYIGGNLGGAAYLRRSTGFVGGGNQYALSETATFTSEPQIGKVIQLRDSSNTIILEGTWVSFPTNQVVFNITTSPASMPQAIIEAGN